MRSRSEGGTTFTVCDVCWDKAYPTAPAPDAGAALLKEARGAVGPFLRLLAKSYEIVMPSLRGLFALSKRRHRVEAVIARIDAELEKQP